jgi:tripartite-type tricarboxylate transporter receptor subunit TctC
MPPDVVKTLERAFIEASRDPEVTRQLSEEGIYVRGLPGKDLDALIRADIVKWRRVVKASGITAD